MLGRLSTLQCLISRAKSTLERPIVDGSRRLGTIDCEIVVQAPHHIHKRLSELLGVGEVVI